MRTELENHLLSGIIKKASGETIYRSTAKPLVSMSGLFTVAVSFAAAMGLILLILSKVKPLF